jgi:hypothetical protein
LQHRDAAAEAAALVGMIVVMIVVVVVLLFRVGNGTVGIVVDVRTLLYSTLLDSTLIDSATTRLLVML